jgi:outer membrane protein assembly factor BamB
VPLGTIAAAPVEGGGIVYSVSTLGMTSAVEAATGKVLWSFRTLPGFYAMADAAAQDGVVYVAGMDGSVTAIAPR